MDETSIQALGKSLKVVVPKSFKKATAKALPHFNHHMTLILAVSADGTALPRPTVILPLQRLPALCDPVIDAFDFAGTETGWITIPVWSSWILTVFIPYVNAKRAAMTRGFSAPMYGRSILFLDSHASRLDEYTHTQLEANGIIVVTIPSHTSHILQPLDCGINNALKFALRNLTFLNFIRLDAGLSEYRNSLLYCVKAALVDAQNFLRIASAFEVCGMWPWNPSRVLSDSTKVTPSLVVPTTPEKATATQSITGRVVTSGMIAASRLRREEDEKLAELVKLAKIAEKEDRSRAREEERAAKAAARTVREASAAKRKEEKASRLLSKRKSLEPQQAGSANPTPPATQIETARSRKRARAST